MTESVIALRQRIVTPPFRRGENCMKKLFAIIAATMFSAQAGYCAGSALESLKILENKKQMQAPVDSGLKLPTFPHFTLPT